MTHVLVACVMHHQELSGTLSLSLAQSRPELWDFRTPWSVAKQLLHAKFRTVRVRVLDHSEDDDYSTVVPIDTDACPQFEIWPTMYKRPRQPREPRGGDPEPREGPSRKNRGGVKTLSPKTVLVGRAEPAAPAAAAVEAEPAAPPAPAAVGGESDDDSNSDTPPFSEGELDEVCLCAVLNKQRSGCF